MSANGIASAVLFSSLLLTASLWDIRKRIIPDSLCLGIAAVGLFAFSPVKLFGILLALPLLVAALVKEGGMGGGDVKFTAACGFVLGLPVGSVGLVLGLSAALAWHIVTRGVHRLKRVPLKSIQLSSLPLVPFLSFGFAVAHMLK